ncbi:MAG: hypothetical protein ABI760_21190 [Ferruginibacter sp.]
MKRLFISLTALFFISFLNDSFAQAKPKAGKAKNMVKDHPFKATYSSNFTIGKAAYSKMILDLWKDWDDNNFDRHDYMADSLVAFFPDGTVTRGKAENLEASKKFRGKFASVKSIIHAWVPLTSTDMNEDVVCVWGQEEDTYPDGKVEKSDLHEVWWFNKAGKVTRLRQWAAKFGE